jgi:regulator of sigma E protease
MDILLYNILPTVLVLGVLIFVHEAGHFILAKRLRVGVEVFSLGFGPRLLGFRRKETDYRLSAFPLGGYVKMVGEDPSASVTEPGKSFSLKPAWARILIVLAGPVSNYLFAVLVFALLFTFLGVPEVSNTVGFITKEYPAYEAGLREGDKILEVDGKKIKVFEDIRALVEKAAGRELTLLVEREGKALTFKVTPKLVKGKTIFGEEQEVGKLGIGGHMSFKPINPLISPYYGLVYSLKATQLTVMGLVKVIQGRVPFREAIGGPLTIAKMVGDIAKISLLALCELVAMISISLAILNILPIPILDGGHLAFFVIEWIRGRAVSLRVREVANQVGLVILGALIVLVFYSDIMRLFFK